MFWTAQYKNLPITQPSHFATLFFVILGRSLHKLQKTILVVNTRKKHVNPPFGKKLTVKILNLVTKMFECHGSIFKEIQFSSTKTVVVKPT